MGVRKFPEQVERVETGAVQFGDDWPGIFIRGDNAMYYAHLLNSIIDRLGKGVPMEEWDALALQSIRDTLRECDARTHPEG
jgi:hypothetical protein